MKTIMTALMTGLVATTLLSSAAFAQEEHHDRHARHAHHAKHAHHARHRDHHDGK